jgi:hypothetical protein
MSFSYLEPTSSGWRPVGLNRADRLSFYFCSGYDFRTANGRRMNDDLTALGCR